MSDGQIVALPPPATDDSEVKATVRLIEAARQSLEEARTLPDIRRVMEAASVAADAAQRAAKLAQAHRWAEEVVDAATEVANDAAAIRIEAQAKAGELLKALELDRGGRPKRDGNRSQAATGLDELGVTKSESSRWQQVAAVPLADRAEYVAETKTSRGEVSTAGLLKHAAAATRTPRQAPGRRVDHAAIAAEAQKHVRKVYRDLLALPGFRPESLVAGLDSTERRHLLRAVDQITAWLDDVKNELAIHHTKKEV